MDLFVLDTTGLHLISVALQPYSKLGVSYVMSQSDMTKVVNIEHF
jgi:hypothetical protein